MKTWLFENLKTCYFKFNTLNAKFIQLKIFIVSVSLPNYSLNILSIYVFCLF